MKSQTAKFCKMNTMFFIKTCCLSVYLHNYDKMSHNNNKHKIQDKQSNALFNNF